MKYHKLFESIKIGVVELSNRIVLPPMTTNFAKNGFVTDEMIHYYVQRAKGGAGLIVVEDAIIDSPIGNHSYNCLRIDGDRYISGLRRLVEAISKDNIKVFLSLNHGGRRAGRVENGYLRVTRGKLPVAPSSLPHPVPGFVVPKELSLEEIAELEKKFFLAACRAKAAGFHGVSIHAAHMYLISEFLSPAANCRQDIYGGNAENRLRFIKNIIQRIKTGIGSAYPVMVRMNGREGIENGITIEEAKRIAVGLEQTGVDCISLSCGAGTVLPIKNFPTPVAPMRLPHCLEVKIAASIKQIISVPVMTANRIVTPQEAEDIVCRGEADLVGIGRGLIADPEWPRKAQFGRTSEIRFCIGCMHCFQTVIESGKDMRCSVNVAVGREDQCRIVATKKKKNIFIAGAGPAGMEAARVAALRGHRVSLFERSRIGGQLNLAKIPLGKGDIWTIVEFEKKQLVMLGVQIHNQELTVNIINKENPDVVIIASGATPFVPGIPTASDMVLLNAWQVLQGDEIRGHNVAVIGGGMVGVETAEYIASKGKRVTLIEQLEYIASDMDRTNLNILRFRLEELGVVIITSARVISMEKKGVHIVHKGENKFVEADMIVLSTGVQPNQDLIRQIESLGVQYLAVGDCKKAGKLADAISDGFDAGFRV